MSKRVLLKVTMELLSDTILGSGFSIPGGEDIAVCKDDAGYPYMKGSTFKGLLRESCENLLDWMGDSGADVNTLFGEEGWMGTTDDRRILVSPLTLTDFPKEADSCYSLRTFTKLDECGIVSDGTLRTASCICAGLAFSGEVECGEADAALLKDSLAAMKWVGTMRNRGFGRVRMTAVQEEKSTKKRSVGQTNCIHYVLHTEAPVLSTDLSRSQENSYETYGFITGSAVRGMVMGYLSKEENTFFAENKETLLSDRVRFTDAIPNPYGVAALPSLKGFYADKGSDEIESVVCSGEVKPGRKRASMGAFCTLDGETIRFWSAKTDGAMRISRNTKNQDDKQLFQTRYLSEGQDLEGYILLDDESLSPKVAEAFSGEIRLGADRYEGFGKCTIKALEEVAAPAWLETYGGAAEETMYLVAVSPFTMINDHGEPCGLNEKQLAEALGVASAKAELCSTSVVSVGSFNRKWQCREEKLPMYDRGSVFKLSCEPAPTAEAVKKLEYSGIGMRREEGYGQVVFLSKSRFEMLTKKKAADMEAERDSDAEAEKKAAEEAKLRRLKCLWVMEYAPECEKGISRSQLGTIQSLCEKAILNGGDTKELRRHLEKNKKERGAAYETKYERIGALIRDVLDHPLDETLKCGTKKALERRKMEEKDFVLCGTTDTLAERLKLLVMLFDFSRKEKDKEKDSKEGA